MCVGKGKRKIKKNHTLLLLNNILYILFVWLHISICMLLFAHAFGSHQHVLGGRIVASHARFYVCGCKCLWFMVPRQLDTSTPLSHVILCFAPLI